MKRLIAATLGAVILLGAGQVRAVDPADANWSINLDKAFGVNETRKGKEDRDLELYINVLDGQIVSGVGWASRYNRAGHRVTKGDLRLDGDKFTAELTVTMNPDRWVPADGETDELTVTLTGNLKAGEDGPAVTGEYRGKFQGQAIKGDLTGQVVERPEVMAVTLPGRLFPEKIDERDFPEMEVEIGLRSHGTEWGRIAMTWHRWPYRWSMFDAAELTWDRRRQTLTGSMVVPARAVDVASPPDARYRLVWDGAFIGRMYVTTVTAEPVEGSDVPKRTFNGGGLVREGATLRDKPEEYTWLFSTDTDPWFVEVDDYQPVQPNEHPRILFRADQVEAIRKRARTEEGKQIVARLRRLLDGGDGTTIPTNFNQTPPHNHNHSEGDVPVGTMFTSFHAPGYAMLYQLTGEQRYADLARKSVELMFEGAIDRDNRYAWTRPGTELRAGTLLASVALAYDLAFDGWDKPFRQKVARALAEYDQPNAAETSRISTRLLMGRTGYPPASNHYGSQFGGTLLAMLAVRGDDGVDQQFVEDRIEEGLWMIPNFFAHAFGEGGWYQEGPHPSRLSTNGGFVMALQAVKNAYGRDYIAPRPNGQFATLRWVYWLTADSNGHPLLLNRGTYGNDQLYGRAPMLSHSGDFVFGFGAVEDKYKPAVLWTYENFVETWEQGKSRPFFVEEGERSFNSFVYPMHAVLALVNWPVETEPVNPGKLLPRHHVDTVNDFFVSRNRWQDRQDIVVTFSTGGGPWGYHRSQRRGRVMVRAYGRGINVPGRFGHNKITGHAWAKDGSFTLGMNAYFYGRHHGMVAVDLTGRSGAELVIVQTTDKSQQEKWGEVRNPPDGIGFQEQRRIVGDRLVHVVTIDREAKPKISITADRIKVGDQTYRTADGMLWFDGLKPGDRGE